MFLVVGLGNPGRSYFETRHNVGFMLLDRLAQQEGKRFQPLGTQSVTCMVERVGRKVILAKPQTYMNRSGRAVWELLEHCPGELAGLLIAYDELALPLGKIRIRRSGTSGGHKGIESIIQSLGTTEIPRLRIGIGSEELPNDYSQFVLEPFTEEELKTLDQVLERATQALDTLFSEGIERAMSLYN